MAEWHLTVCWGQGISSSSLTEESGISYAGSLATCSSPPSDPCLYLEPRPATQLCRGTELPMVLCQEVPSAQPGSGSPASPCEEEPGLPCPPARSL